MTQKVRLLVRVDDAGSSWSSNIGCLRACTEGIARSVEVMMPGAWVTHAANLFNAHPNIDIGIHLTLASEWEAVKWRPLTNAPSLTDDQGFFLPLVFPRKGDPRPSLAEAKWSLDEIAAEFRAQMQMGLRLFHQASHVSSHMLRHFRDLDPRMGELVATLCKEFDLADDAFGYDLPRMAGYPAHPRDESARTQAFVEQVSDIDAGTWIFIDHPAVPSPELEALGHVGYEDVAADRVSCLETLVSADITSAVEQLGIDLISYKDL